MEEISRFDITTAARPHVSEVLRYIGNPDVIDGHNFFKGRLSMQRTCVLQCVAVCCSVLQHVAPCCSVLQRVAACCSVLQRVAACCSVLQRVAVCCSMLQRVAACCSVLQRGAACCSVLQCVALRYRFALLECTKSMQSSSV